MWPEIIPGLGVVGVEFAVGSRLIILTPRGFPTGTPLFLFSLKNQHFQMHIQSGEHSHTVKPFDLLVMESCAIQVYKFVYLFNNI